MNPLAPETEWRTQGWFFCFPSAFEESSRQPMYRNRRQHQKCNASTPTKPILHEKCNYHGKDEYSHVFYGALIFPIAILSIIWYNISVKLVAKTDNNPQTMCKTELLLSCSHLGVRSLCETIKHMHGAHRCGEMLPQYLCALFCSFSKKLNDITTMPGNNCQ